MIPYDDLVAALSSWRARQGLPTGQLQGSHSRPNTMPTAAPAAAAPAAAARSATKPGAVAAAAPAAASGRVPVRAASEPAMDADDFVEEASFDNALDNAFGSDNLDEATAIGSAPTPTAPSRRR